jgi:hypothetical protein
LPRAYTFSLATLFRAAMQHGLPAMHRVGAWIEGGYSERHRYIKVEGQRWRHMISSVSRFASCSGGSLHPMSFFQVLFGARCLSHGGCFEDRHEATSISLALS